MWVSPTALLNNEFGSVEFLLFDRVGAGEFIFKVAEGLDTYEMSYDWMKWTSAKKTKKSLRKTKKPENKREINKKHQYSI